MRHNYILTASILGGALLLAASCVKEKSNDDIYRPAGSEIIFGAATEYANGDGTRTEYSGSDVTSGASTYERINWVSGDDMKIYYAIDGTNAQNGIYDVDGAGTTSGKESHVGITARSTKLTWGTGSSHRFRAVYPASAGFDGTTVSGSIPASQTVTLNSTQGRYLPNMSYAYMVSQLTVPSSSTTSRVDLPFTPAMTAFQFKFKVNSTDEPVTVTSFEISTENSANPLTGGFSFPITGEVANVGADWNKALTGTNPTVLTGSNGHTVTVSFGGNVTLGKTDYLDFTVLALPIDISQVTIKFNFAGGLPSKSMKLKKNGSWVTFDACKKYVITNEAVPGGETWTYYVEEIPDITAYGHNPVSGLGFTVKSYKVSSRNPTVKVAVPWTVQYSADGSSWSTTNGSSDFSLSTTSGDGVNTTTYSTGESNSAAIAHETVGETTGGASDATRAALASATPRGTDSAPFDLSIHPVYGQGSTYADKQAYITTTTVNRETANSYVISAPGVYMFPCVYGNAYHNGAINTKSYNPGGTASNYHITSFLNTNDADITKPWILDDLSSSLNNVEAAIVWQDVPSGSEIIQYDKVSVIGTGVQDAYIKFVVSADDIRQGNVIIALREKTGSHKIYWSWHIWISEKDLSPVAVTSYGNHTNHSTVYTNYMMTHNLGWTDATSASSTKYPNRSYHFKIVQTETGGTSETFKVEQIGDSKSVAANIGSNLFYQWGRKDPMIPAAGSDLNKTVSTGTGYSVAGTDNAHTAHVTIYGSTLKASEAIQNPHKMYYNSNTWGWMDGNSTNSYIGNLWNGDIDGNSESDDLTLKTVYDPCPPGFCVPRKYAFTGFVIAQYAYFQSNQVNGVLDTGARGIKFYTTGDDRTGSIFFPFTGARGAAAANIYDVTHLGYYWTSVPTNYGYSGFGRLGYQCAKYLHMYDGYYGDTNSYNPSASFVRAEHDQYRGAAYSIRPVLQERF